jgi:hypothetical protein
VQCNDARLTGNVTGRQDRKSLTKIRDENEWHAGGPLIADCTDYEVPMRKLPLSQCVGKRTKSQGPLCPKKIFLRSGLLVLTFAALTSNGLAQTISTYAGPLLPVEGAQAITQTIDSPYAVAPDGGGGFYVASLIQNKIYQVAADGTLRFVTGGSPGYGGDGGPAGLARIAGPIGLAADASGNLFIADAGNRRIRKVTAGGIISTVAGGGETLGDGGPATSALLDSPLAVTVDAAGNLYIADTYSSRVRKVTANGVISTMAGNGTSGLRGDGGPATSAELYWPRSVAVDVAGNVYIGTPITSVLSCLAASAR